MQRNLSTLFVLVLGIGIAQSASSQSAAPESIAPAGQQASPAPPAASDPLAPVVMQRRVIPPNPDGRKMGIVTDISANSFTIKSDSGALCKIQYSADTRMFGTPRPGEMGRSAATPGGEGNEGKMEPAKARFLRPNLKPEDVKLGDMLLGMGVYDATKGILNAESITRIDPDRVRSMKETRETNGKTWIEGTVTALNGNMIRMTSSLDGSTHTISVNANTRYRKRDLTISLADFHVGDLIRVQGLLTGDVFNADGVRLRSYPVSDFAPKSAAGASEAPPQAAAPQN